MCVQYLDTLLLMKIWYSWGHLCTFTLLQGVGHEEEETQHTSINSQPTFSRGKYFPVENREVIVVAEIAFVSSFLAQIQKTKARTVAHIMIQKETKTRK